MLKGHTNQVKCLAVFPDSKLASGGGGEIRISNTQTGTLLAIFGDNAYEALKTVVEIHEATHALWHVGLDGNNRAWGNPDAASSVLHEIIAEYYTQALCRRLGHSHDGDRCQLLLAMYENLNGTHRPDSAYRLHERLDGIDGEAVRSFFLSFRQGRPRLTWDGLWNAVLETLITLLPFLEKHLAPVEIEAIKDWVRHITDNKVLSMEQGCDILAGLGRLPALRQAIETAIRRPFPDRDEAILLCLAKICKLSPESGPSLPFTLDAARNALRLEKPRIEPALLNHPVVRSLWDSLTGAPSRKSPPNQKMSARKITS